MSYGDYPDLSKVKKILVIKLRHLGDVLLTTALFGHLKKVLPLAQIDAFVYEEARPILEGHPAIDTIIGMDRNKKSLGFFQKLQREYCLLKMIRENAYDLVINLTEGDRGVIASILSRAKIRVGFSPKGKWQKKCLTHIVKSAPGLRHTVERNLDALRRIGIFPSIDERDLFLEVPAESILKMRSLVGGEPFVLVHPTSRWRFKCWSVSKMRQLLMGLLENGKKVVLTSGPDQDEVAYIKEISENLDVKVLAGQISIKELSALVSLSECLVCVDSVVMHIASALKAPVVVLFGPTSEVTWGPWKNPYAKIITQNISCRPCYQDGCGGSKVADCLQTIEVDTVLKQVLVLGEVESSV